MKQHPPNWITVEFRGGSDAFPASCTPPSSFKCSMARSPTTHPLLVGPLLQSLALKDDPHADPLDLTSIHPNEIDSVTRALHR